MKEQINKRWQSLLLVTIAAVIMLGASFSALAQKSMTAKFPKPDFKAMEEYWEVTDYEYNYATGSVAEFSVVAKKKQEKVPRYWVITWRDDKGVKVSSFTLIFEAYNIKDAKIGEPVRGSSYAPEQIQIPKIKSVVVTEKEDSPWAWNNVDVSNPLFASLLDLNGYAETAQPEH